MGEAEVGMGTHPELPIVGAGEPAADCLYRGFCELRVEGGLCLSSALEWDGT